MIGATFDCIYFDVLFVVQVSLPLIRLYKIICAIVMTRLNFFNSNEMYLLLSSGTVILCLLSALLCLCCDWAIDFQNTRETAHAIRKLPLAKAKRYLEDVLVHKQAIPFRRFCRGVGRTAQAKNRHSNGQGRWPFKSAKFILDLLKNAESNAEVCFTIVDILFLVQSFLNHLKNCVNLLCR